MSPDFPHYIISLRRHEPQKAMQKFNASPQSRRFMIKKKLKSFRSDVSGWNVRLQSLVDLSCLINMLDFTEHLTDVDFQGGKTRNG